ncbi:hypothetical protein [Gloeocapsa sp. PCC 73106]|uniref:hypothetical protein n=1 Tax=Gloeocapsa sp. PCC 73106 TaxID=102232 RepID=UPI0002ABEF7A|nr:hypothetical protein [Gloeocapsa sp. PCC 73106]ELS00141.1 hypothetical protein GLO73106DRAFT_00039960 [Gloeocapsa sp. PCC 73106]
MKYGFIFALIISQFLTFYNLPAIALNCYDYQGQKICLLNIQRSAKYYWQYRVDVTINGKKQPQTTYNCLQKTKQSKSGNILDFTTNDLGQLICSLFD